MSDGKRKFWTVGQIDATGVRGPHEKELDDISKAKYPIFINLSPDKRKKIVEEFLGGKVENIGLSEDWAISMEMFPEVNIHMAYSYFGDEFGDGIEAEFKFYFSGKRCTWVPGEDSATFIDIVMDFIEREVKNKEPFEKNFNKKTELMEKVLEQRKDPFKHLKEEDKDDLAKFIGARVWKTTEGWRIKREMLPKMFAEITWTEQAGLDIAFSGDNIDKLGSYHAEFVGIFTINHILRYITIKNEEKDLPDICRIMFSRMFTKDKGWEHRTR